MKKLTHEFAAAAMRERGFEPLEEYPGSDKPWRGLCMECGAEVSPCYDSVAKRGQGACQDCGNRRGAALRKKDGKHAAAAMRERGFEPLEEYPGSDKPWRGLCMECGAEVTPRYHGVVNHSQGICGVCRYVKSGNSLRLPQSEAEAVMLAVHFQPSVPYPGSAKPWPGVCLKCGQPGSPRKGDVSKGHEACAFCAETKVDGAIAVGKMMAADFQPTIDYPGANTPWYGVCLICGERGLPRYHNVVRGHNACRNCASNSYKSSRAGYFYFVAGSEWLKGGITNVPQARLARHRSQGMTQMLYMWKFADGTVPQRLEAVWMEHLMTLSDCDRPKKIHLNDGYTEAVRRTADIEHWIEQCFKPLADGLLA